MTRLLTLLTIAVLVWCASSVASPFPYLHDASEFALSGFYLDISHPAGFPTYAQLSNLLSLIPIGSIAWRANLFSAFVALGVLVGVTTGALLLLGRIPSLRAAPRFLLAALAPLTLCSSPAFISQAATAEAYQLNALFIVILLNLFLLSQERKDLRYILAAAFVGGIGFGNHISIGGPLLIAIVTVIASGATRKVFIPSALLFIFGLGVYGLLPMRSDNPLPLRTGEPGTVARFLNQITDGRDRDLKAKASTDAISSNFALPFSGISNSIGADCRKLAKEISLPLLLVGLIGILLSFQFGKATGSVVLGSFLTIWLFFNGWDPDPWIPAIAILSIGVSLLFALLLRGLGRGVQSLAAAIIVTWVLNIPFGTNSLNEIAPLREFRASQRYAHTILNSAPSGGILITEASWFPLAYARYAEGFRDDITLIYQPRILFPSYFEQVALKIGENTFDSFQVTDSGAAAAFDNLALLMNMSGPVAELSFEPSIVINKFFSNVAILDGSPVAHTIQGRSKEINASFIDARHSVLKQLLEAGNSATPKILSDIESMARILIVNDVDLLNQMDAPQTGTSLLKDSCAAGICFSPSAS